MLPVFTKPLDSLDRADLEYLLEQGYPEGSQVEYKRDLPCKREGGDQWHQGINQIGEYARNQLLSEVVAFANAYGGHLLLGIEESATQPPIAQSLKPLPRCADLAEKLRLQARDTIEPQLPAFHTRGIVTEPDGAGVVVVRVPRSLAAPHRLTPTLECYYRRADRSERLTMREIQELTLSRARETQLIDQRFGERRDLFRSTVQSAQQASDSDLPINAIRVTLVPLASNMQTGRLLNHPRIKPFCGAQKAKMGQRELKLGAPSLSRQPRPILRGVQFKGEEGRLSLYQNILENGIVDDWFLDEVRDSNYDAVYPEWLMGIAVNAILTANRVRQEAGSPEAEYGVELEVFRHPKAPMALGRYGSESQVHVTGKLASPTVLPRLSFTDKAEILLVLANFNRDLFNTIGVEPSHDLEVVIPDALLEAISPAQE